MSSFDRITNDSKNDIFNFLSYKDLHGAAPVCSAWCDIANERKEKIHKKVGEVLKDNYNKLVDKKNVNTERRPWKKAEKIVIKNLKSGVCQMVKENSNDCMYYRIPPELLKKLLLTTDVESVESLHKLPENKKWIQQHKGHKKFSFPDKTFVEVFSSHDQFDANTLSMIDISDFESNQWSEFIKTKIKGSLALHGSHTLDDETKEKTLIVTQVCFSISGIVGNIAGFFLGNPLVMVLASLSSFVGCGILIKRNIETKSDLDTWKYFYLNSNNRDEIKRSEILDECKTKMETLYFTYRWMIKTVMKAYRDNEKLSSEKSKQIQEWLVDNNLCLKMYIEKISTKKPEVIRAFQTLFPQVWEGS